MADAKHANSRRQRTRPKKGKPVEIPVPTRGDFERVLKKVAKSAPSRKK